jgi:hypothetical protein
LPKFFPIQRKFFSMVSDTGKFAGNRPAAGKGIERGSDGKIAGRESTREALFK